MRSEGEVVLIFHEDQPVSFARIESIELDIKKDWYHITLLLLNLPFQTVTWILRESYIDGEPFTMGGTPMRLEEVKKILPKREEEKPDLSDKKKAPEKTGTVVPFKKPKQ